MEADWREWVAVDRQWQGPLFFPSSLVRITVFTFILWSLVIFEVSMVLTKYQLAKTLSIATYVIFLLTLWWSDFY